jgi:hypothetical protein
LAASLTVRSNLNQREQDDLFSHIYVNVFCVNTFFPRKSSVDSRMARRWLPLPALPEQQSTGPERQTKEAAYG